METTMKNKIEAYRKTINKFKVNEKEVMVYAMKNWNSEGNYNELSVEEMIESDIVINEGEAKQTFTETEVIELAESIVDMYLEFKTGK